MVNLFVFFYIACKPQYVIDTPMVGHPSFGTVQARTYLLQAIWEQENGNFQQSMTLFEKAYTSDRNSAIVEIWQKSAISQGHPDYSSTLWSTTPSSIR